MLLTIRNLADSLLFRGRDILVDTTYSVAPHGDYSGLVTIFWVGAVVVVVLAAGLLYGLYRALS